MQQHEWISQAVAEKKLAAEEYLLGTVLRYSIAKFNNWQNWPREREVRIAVCVCVCVGVCVCVRARTDDREV